MSLVDRLLTIVVTATITSAIWIVAGGSLIENSRGEDQIAATRPAEAAPSPVAGSPMIEEVPGGEGRVVSPELSRGGATKPDLALARELRIPVLNVRAADLSDTFTNSLGSGARLHEAIDIMAPKGTSVVAAAPGVIEKMFNSAAGGKTIYVRSPDGRTIHYYAHLDAYAEGLKEQQRIRRGQRLGTVGSTGNASPDAPHLHFAILRTTKEAEWWEPANAVNPYPLLTGK